MMKVHFSKISFFSAAFGFFLGASLLFLVGKIRGSHADEFESTVLDLAAQNVFGKEAEARKVGDLTIISNKINRKVWVVPGAIEKNAVVLVESSSGEEGGISFVEISNLVGKSVFVSLRNNSAAFDSVGMENRKKQKIRKDLDMDGIYDLEVDKASDTMKFRIDERWLNARESGSKIQVQENGSWSDVELVDGRFTSKK